MEVFKKHGVLPDVIDSLPEKILHVKYGSHSVDPGETLTPTQVKHSPTVEFEADPSAFYSLLMHDPDAPSRQNPKMGEWRHWVVVNIPGQKLTEGQILAEYVGSGPPKGTGLHRYVFLVYRQPGGKITFSESKLSKHSAEGRAKHRVKEFAAKHGLKDLVAANFFQAEWDDYVPHLHEQLQGK